MNITPLPDWIGYLIFFLIAIWFLVSVHKKLEVSPQWRRNNDLFDWTRAWIGVVVGMILLWNMVASY